MKYNEYYIFIVAPASYLQENHMAASYPNRISYEELMENADAYGAALLFEAIREKKNGYSIIPDEAVTVFWKRLYEHVGKHYKKLNPYIYEGPRGANANWPTYRMPVKGTKIQHKSDRGFVDLEISGYADKYQTFMRNNENHLSEDMLVTDAGKSLAVRLVVEPIDFHKPFDEQVEQVEESLKAAMRLQNLLKQLVF